MRPRWPSCCGLICCPRPGSHPSRSATYERCCVTAPPPKNRVHAVPAARGISEDRILWTGSGRAWLADLELPATPRAIIQDCCGLLDALAAPIARLEREIAGLAKPDTGARPSWSCPGWAG